jgi:hypothetical protein
LGEETLLAIEAAATRSVVKTHHAIAGSPLRYASTHGNDRASKLMAKDLRRLDIALKDFFDVRTANAARSDFDEDFALAYLGDRNLLNVDDPFVAVDPRAHRLRDWPQRFQSLWRCSQATHVAETSSALA